MAISYSASASRRRSDRERAARRWPRLLTTLLTLVALSPAVASALTVTDLGANFVPADVNDHRVVVGDIDVEIGNDSFTQAALWKDGVLAPLPTRQGVTESEAYAVSDQGRVAGMEYSGSTGDVHAVFWDTRSGPIQIGPLSIEEVDFSLAKDADAAGNVVGTSSAFNLPGQHPFLGFYAAGGGSPIAVGTGDLDAAGSSSSVGAISGDGTKLLGQVTGTATRDGYYLWSTTAPAAAGTKLAITPAQNLGFKLLAGSVYNQLLIHNAIASDGTVLGYKDGQTRTWHLRAPNGTETPVLGLTAHNAINAEHVVAGSIATGNAQDPVHAAIWDPATQQVTDLNTLLPPDSGFRLLVATAINDEGDIAGVAIRNQQEVGFLLNGAPDVLTLAMTATPPRAQGAKAGETVRYTLDATLTEQAPSLVLTAKFNPDYLEIDPDSITGGGVLAGDTITWQLANTTGTGSPLEFDGAVKQLLPDTVLFIPMQGHALATLADASEAEAEANATVPYLKSNLTIDGSIETPRGDYVLPEDEILVRLSASAKNPAEDLTLEATIPVGTKLVANSITGGGTSKGGKVRWRFGNVDQTPEVQFRVQVVEQKKLKKDQKEVVFDFVATGTFGESQETATETVTIDLIRPTDLRGIVRDIVFTYPKRNDAKTPPLDGVEVRLFDNTNAVVDSATTDKKGTFTLRIIEAGNYRLEARRLGDVYSPLTNSIDAGSRYVRSEHFVKLDDTGRLSVDGVELVRDKSGIPVPFDAAYVPLALVRRASDLIYTARNFRIDYLFLLKFDIAPLLGELVHYDVTKASAMLDKAIALDFLNDDGSLSHFKGLYRGTGDKDPWNAVIRLCAFLVQLDQRMQEAARLSDALAKTVALAVTTAYVGKVLPATTGRWRTRLGGSTAQPAAAVAVAARSTKMAKIGTMAFGVGTGLPFFLEHSGIVGQEKAQWIEVIAKGLRYGVNVFGARYLPGALREDLTFEEIFNLVRIGLDLAVIERYVTSTQSSLDRLADVLALGVYSGDTIQAFNVADRISAAIQVRTHDVLTFFAGVLGEISILRGAEGVLGVGTPFLLKPPGASNPFPALTKFFKAEALEAGANLKKGGLYFIPVQYALVTVAVIDELIVRKRDVIRIEETLVDASDPTKSARMPDPAGVPAFPPVDAPGRADQARAKFKPPKVPKIAPTEAIQAYVDVLTRIAKLVGKGDAEGYANERDALLAAHDALFDDLDAVYDRVTLAMPLVSVDRRVQLLSFLEARNALEQAASIAYSFLEIWVAAPESSDVKGPVKKTLALVPVRAKDVNGFLPTALDAIAGLTIPGGIVVRPDSEPDQAAVLAGASFDLRFVVANPGDTAVAASEAELLPGETLEVLSEAAQDVPALGPGEAVTLTWQVEAQPASPVGFLGGAQVVVRRDGAIVAIATDPIAEYDPDPSVTLP